MNSKLIAPSDEFAAAAQPLHLERLERLVSHLADWVCALDVTGRFVFSNEAVRSILGYHPHELIGRPCSDFIILEDAGRSLQAIRSLKRGYKNIFFENRYRHKDGSVITLHWTGRWDRENDLLYASARDVTKRTLHEELRRQHQQQLQFLSREMTDVLDRVTDGFGALDREWNIIYVNPVLEAMAQVKLNDLENQNFWQSFPDTIGTKFETEYRRAVEEQVPVHFEECYTPTNTWMEVHAYPSGNGLTVFLRDITEQKNIGRELHKLSSILKGTIHSLALTDREGRIIWVNDAFEQKSGYTLGEVQGRRPGEVMSGPATDPAALQYLYGRIAQGKPFRVEVLKYRKDGKTFWSDIYGEPLYDEHQNVVEFFLIETDVTDRKVLEDRLKCETSQRHKKVTAAVIQAQERERSLIGRELHDNINQVLTTVKLYIESCLGGLGDREQLLHRSQQLVSGVINDIRGLSKRLAAPHLEDMRLEEAVQELADNLSLAHQLSISIQMDNLEGLELGGGFQLTVYRILQEHLTNVIKHAAATSVQVALKRTEKALSLIAADNGKGFDPRQKKSGIGMLNMKSRAKSLDGTLKIISSPGKGCTLLASFPLQKSIRSAEATDERDAT